MKFGELYSNFVTNGLPPWILEVIDFIFLSKLLPCLLSVVVGYVIIQ